MNKTLIKKFIVKKGESRDLNEVYVFDKPRVKKNYLYKVVVEEGGSIDMRVNVLINKKAIKTDVYLKMEVLLLGKTAKAIAVPTLEILCNDVKAGHAASIGRIDENQIFYLMSRGISRLEAVELSVKAFLN